MLFYNIFTYLQAFLYLNVGPPQSKERWKSTAEICYSCHVSPRLDKVFAFQLFFFVCNHRNDIGRVYILVKGKTLQQNWQGQCFVL